MGKRSRTKGATWEREVATLLRGAGFPGAMRGLAQARSARECADVEGTPWWVECKHGARVNVPGAVRQALDATDGRPVLVVAKRDREEPTVTMTLATFLRLVHAVEQHAPGACFAGTEAVKTIAQTYGR